MSLNNYLVGLQERRVFVTPSLYYLYLLATPVINI